MTQDSRILPELLEYLRLRQAAEDYYQAHPQVKNELLAFGELVGDKLDDLHTPGPDRLRKLL